MKSSNTYSRDLALVHDLGFSDIATAAANFLKSHLSRSKITSGLVVDLGCGSGNLAELMTRHSFDVLGIDHSSSMIRRARMNAPSARFKVASIHDVDIPTCQAVICTGEVLSYEFDGPVTVRRVERLVRKVARSLETGGFFVFDILVLDNRPQSRVFLEGKKWFVAVEKTLKGSRLSRRVITFVKDGKNYRRTDETHVVRLFDCSVIVSVLRRNGFSVKLLKGYNTYRFRKGHVGFLCRRTAG